MVGGATVIGIGELDEYVTPRFCEAGDKLIITKGPAIEATGIFAAMLPKVIEKECGKDIARKSQEVFYKMSVVEDAMTAVSVGVRKNGVTALHDATECGVWGGLFEVAQASGLGARIDKDKIIMEESVAEVCKLFGIDPYASISEGTLIIACKAHKAEAVVKALAAKKIKSSIVGELTKPEQGMILVEKGKEKPLVHPIVDPFWRAFYGALEKYKGQ
jgi:hydrogenase maturation factor